MASKTNTQNQVKEITDRLAQGIKDLFASDGYADYLRTMSRFHSYSTRNTVLIHMQKPDATLVAGFTSWKNQWKRTVKKGEKGIRILAPTPFTVKKEMEKIDPATQRPVLDDFGLPVTEEVEVKIPRFKAVSVFDVSQTTGEPLPSLAQDIGGNVEHYALLMDAIRELSPLPIALEPLDPDTDGTCRHGVGIALREGMSEAQTVSAAVHEVAHAVLHDPDRQQEGADTPVKDDATKEVEAESVSYAVCQYFGIETAPNSFGYLAHWSGDKDLKELTASLDTIRRTAATFIDNLEERYRALAKERGIELVGAEPAREAEPPAVQEPDAPVAESPAPELLPNQHTWEIGGVEFVFTTITPQTERPPAQEEPAAPVEQPWETSAIGEDPPFGELLLPEPGPMPDPAITPAERDAFGYTDPDILPLTQGRALELFDGEQTVYLLFPDNTEQMAFDREEIQSHDGIFGVEAAEWRDSPEYSGLLHADSEAARESAFLHSEGDALAIYQLKDSADLRYHRFTGMEQLERDGLTVDRANYHLVYTGPLRSGDALDHIYMQFNLDRPADFTGHSLSVSDVIVLHQSGAVTSHYVDSTDFLELPAFLGEERQPEQTSSRDGNTLDDDRASSQTGNTPDGDHHIVPADNPPYSQNGNMTEHSGPTVAELEQTVKEGGQISLMDLARAMKNEAPPARKGKPSILAQLQEFRQTAAQAADPPKTAPTRHSGREV